MYKLGLAAISRLTNWRVGGALVAASTLTTIPQVDGPPWYEILSRILSAAGEIFVHWPGGVPFNWASFILEVLEATGLVDLAAKIDEFMISLLDVPRLAIGQAVFTWILIAAMAPMYIFAVLNMVRYAGAYRKETSTERGEQRVRDGRSQILDVGPWLVTRVLPWLAISPGFHLLVIYIFTISWMGLFAVLTVFYNGTGDTMGGLFVKNIERMAGDGLNAWEFLGATVAAVASILIIFAVIVKRFVVWIKANPKFQWDSTKSLRGLRLVTIAKPGRKYLEYFFKLALTIIVVGLGPLIVYGLGNIPVVPVGFWIFAWVGLVIWIPREAVDNTPGEFYKDVSAKWDAFMSPYKGIDPEEMGEEPEPPQQGRVRSYLGRQAQRAVDLAAQNPENSAEIDQLSKVMAEHRRGRSEPIVGGGAFSEIHRRRNQFPGDEQTQNAMYAWLQDQYEVGTPSETPESLIAKAEAAVRGMKRTNRQVFRNMAERGQSLWTNEEKRSD